METMKLSELKAKSPADLLTFAEEYEVENASTMRKQELMFAILKELAAREIEIVGEGVVEVGLRILNHVVQYISAVDSTQRAAASSADLVGFLDPGHLDRLEDLLAAVLRIVVEAGQRHHPLHEVGEAHGLRIGVRARLGERDGDLARIGPLHFFPPPSRS